MSRNSPKTPMYESRITTDRSTVRSLDPVHISSFRNNSSVREIVVKTDEPDIPQITITRLLKQQDNPLLNKKNIGIIMLINTVNHRKYRNTFSGFIKMINCLKEADKNRIIKSISVNKLKFVLNRNKVSNQMVALNKLKYMSKLYNLRICSSKLIFRMLCVFMAKNMQQASNKLKINVISPAQISQKQKRPQPIKRTQPQKIQEIAFTISQNFLKKIIALSKLPIQTFIIKCNNQLQNDIKNQLTTLNHKNKNKQQNNLVIFIKITDITVGCIEKLKQQLIRKDQEIKKLNNNDNQSQMLRQVISKYQKLSQQFMKDDQEIKKSLDKHKKINKDDILVILHKQVKRLQVRDKSSFEESRIFVIALLTSALSIQQSVQQQPSQNQDSDLSQKLKQIIRIMNNSIQLQKFKSEKLLKAEEFIQGKSKTKKVISGSTKADQLLIYLIDKILPMLKPDKEIRQETIYENQQLFEQQIKNIIKQSNLFIKKIKNKNNKDNKFEIFPLNSPKKRSEQFEGIYQAFRDFASIFTQMKNNVLEQEQQTTQKKTIRRDRMKTTESLTSAKANEAQYNTILEILKKYKQCLFQESYQKWEQFLNSIKHNQHKDTKFTIQAMQSINDFLNSKIQQAQSHEKSNDNPNKTKQLENKLKQQKSKAGKYESELAQLKKKLTTSDENLKKQTIQATNLRKQLENAKHSKQKSVEKKQPINDSMSLDKFRQTYRQLYIKLEKHIKIQVQKKITNKNAQNSRKQQIQHTSIIDSLEYTIEQLKKTIQRLQKKNKTLQQSIRNSQFSPQSEKMLQKQIADLEKQNQQLNQSQQNLRKLQEQIELRQLRYQQQIQRIQNNYRQENNMLTLEIQRIQLEQGSEQSPIKQFQKKSYSSKLSIGRQQFEYQSKKSQQLITRLKKQLQELRITKEGELENINQQFQRIAHHETLDRQEMSQIINNLHKEQVQKDKCIIEITMEINRLKIDLEANKTKYLIMQKKEEKIAYLESRLEQSSQTVEIYQRDIRNKEQYICRLERIIEEKQDEYHRDILSKNQQINQLQMDLRQAQQRKSYQLRLFEEKYQNHIQSLNKIINNLKSQNQYSAIYSQHTLSQHQMKVQNIKRFGITPQGQLDNLLKVVASILADTASQQTPSPFFQIYNQLCKIADQHKSQPWQRLSHYGKVYISQGINKYRKDLQAIIADFRSLNYKFQDMCHMKISTSQSLLSQKFHFDCRTNQQIVYRNHSMSSVNKHYK